MPPGGQLDAPGIRSWRVSVLFEADRIEDALRGISEERAAIVRQHLAVARDSATKKRQQAALGAWWTGSDIERSWLNLHAARQELLMVVGAPEARAQAPLLLSKVKRYIKKSDPARKTYEDWLKAAAKPDGDPDRQRLRAVREAVDRESDLKYANIRRFRNTLLVLMTAVVGLLGVLAVEPSSGTWLPICPAAEETPAEPEDGTSPEPGESPEVEPTSTATQEEADTDSEESTAAPEQECPKVWQIELAGLIGGLIAAGVALWRIPTTGTPYNLRVVQVALKVPMGAIVAIAGTMLLQSRLIDALEPQPFPQVIVYALIFGYGQQAVTRLIDSKANSLATTGEEGGADEEEEDAA